MSPALIRVRDFLTSEHTVAFVITFGLAARKKAPGPLALGGVLLILGVHLSAVQSLGVVTLFVAALAVELLARIDQAARSATPVPVPARRTRP